jgi:hypothetical protein
VLRHYVRDREAYLSLFTDASERLSGDGSPYYLVHPPCAARIAAACPDARILILLRHPADRAWSSYGLLRRQGREPLERFEDALAAEPQRIREGWEWIWHYRALGYYSAMLRRFLSHFPAEAVHVVLFEELLCSPERELAAIHRHLGVDPRPAAVYQQQNASGAARSPALARLIHTRQAAAPILRRMLPRSWLRSLRTRMDRWNTAPASAPDPAVRSRLAHEYREEIATCEEILGRHLEAWSQ